MAEQANGGASPPSGLLAFSSGTANAGNSGSILIGCAATGGRGGWASRARGAGRAIRRYGAGAGRRHDGGERRRRGGRQRRGHADEQRVVLSVASAAGRCRRREACASVRSSRGGVARTPRWAEALRLDEVDTAWPACWAEAAGRLMRTLAPTRRSCCRRATAACCCVARGTGDAGASRHSPRLPHSRPHRRRPGAVVISATSVSRGKRRSHQGHGPAGAHLRGRGGSSMTCGSARLERRRRRPGGPRWPRRRIFGAVHHRRRGGGDPLGGPCFPRPAAVGSSAKAGNGGSSCRRRRSGPRSGGGDQLGGELAVARGRHSERRVERDERRRHARRAAPHGAAACVSLRLRRARPPCARRCRASPGLAACQLGGARHFRVRTAASCGSSLEAPRQPSTSCVGEARQRRAAPCVVGGVVDGATRLAAWLPDRTRRTWKQQPSPPLAQRCHREATAATATASGAATGGRGGAVVERGGAAVATAAVAVAAAAQRAVWRRRRIAGGWSRRRAAAISPRSANGGVVGSSDGSPSRPATKDGAAWRAGPRIWSLDRRKRGAVRVRVGSGTSGSGGLVSLALGAAPARAGGACRRSGEGTQKSGGAILIRTANGGAAGASGQLAFSSGSSKGGTAGCF